MQKGFIKCTASALVLGLILTACGGGDDNNTVTAASSSSVASSTSSSVASSTSSSVASSTSSSVASSTSSSVASSTSSSVASSTSSSTSSSVAATTTIWKPSFTPTMQTTLGASGASMGTNTSFPAMVAPTLVDGLVNLWSSGAGQLRLYSDALLDNTYMVNYNGPSLSATGATIPATGNVVMGATSTTLTRYLSVPYTATAKPVTVKISYVHTSPATCTAAQIGFIDKSGKVLSVSSACGAVDYTDFSTTLTDASNTEIFVIFTRGADSGGGIRIQSVTITK